MTQLRSWATVVGECRADDLISLEELEAAWHVESDTTIAKRKVVVDASRLPMPPDHKEFHALLAVLRERDPNRTQEWLTLVDETRSRRKEVEAAAQMAFADVRASVAVVEEALRQEVVLPDNLAKAWQPLPKGHAELHQLAAALRGEAPNETVSEWLEVLGQTRTRKQEVEGFVATAAIDFDRWVDLIQHCVAKNVASIDALEMAWQTGAAQLTSDAEKRAAATKAAARSADEQGLYERVVTPPGQLEAHEELGKLLDVLQRHDADETKRWLTEVDETRSRRKSIEAASGLTYAQFREWVAAVEEALGKDIVSMGPLMRGWKVGKYADRL